MLLAACMFAQAMHNYIRLPDGQLDCDWGSTLGVWSGLLVLTLALAFTGYLLPWDQLAYWAITIGANIAQSPREVTDALNITEKFDPGGIQRLLLLGSDTVGAEALIRFYLLHVMILPLAMAMLMASMLLAPEVLVKSWPSHRRSMKDWPQPAIATLPRPGHTPRPLAARFQLMSRFPPPSSPMTLSSHHCCYSTRVGFLAIRPQRH